MKTPALAAVGAALLVSLALSSLPAAAKPAPRPYVQVKKELIAKGYRPVPLAHADQDFLCAYDNLCQLFPEVIDCAGTGVAPCMFALLSPKGGYVVVRTYGEETRFVSSIRPATTAEIREIRRRRLAKAR